MHPMSHSDGAFVRLIALGRHALPPARFLSVEGLMVQAGAYAAAAAALLGLGLALFAAIKTDSLTLLWTGLGWVGLVALLHHVGARMLQGCTVVLRNTPSDLSSNDLLEIGGLAGMVGAVVSLALGFYLAVQGHALPPLIQGLGVALALTCLVGLLLHPELLHLRISPSVSAGEDAVALSLLGLKLLTRLAPFMFAALTLGGTLLIAQGLYQAARLRLFLGSLETLVSGFGFGLVALGLLYPLLAYLSFVLGCLVLEVLRAILSLPRLLLQPVTPGHDPEPPRPTSPEPSPPEVPPSNGDARTAPPAWVSAPIMPPPWPPTAETSAADEQPAPPSPFHPSEAAQTMQGRPAAELLKLPVVATALGRMLGPRQRALARYFEQSDPVEVRDGYVIGTGRRTDTPGQHEAIVVLNTRDATVSAAACLDGKVRFLGEGPVGEAPGPIRQWAQRRSL